jgi:hypothetical protein
MIADFHFRALCAELVDLLNRLHSVVWAEASQLLNEDTEGREELDLAIEDALTSARAALAAPEQGPTDEQIMKLMPERLREDLATVSRLAAHGAGPDVGPGLFRVTLNTGAVAHCRAVLARWGRPAIEPVPVAERLPGPEDCDAKGRCWLCGKVEGDWRLINSANSGVPHLKYCFSHWLPHWALPLPQEMTDG